ncbi:MAG TPA: hypothetical protein VFC14_12695, partial [Burkholderiales bacterium]|nr:hypothetical protein [Burkholderiales bacterium]
SNNVFLGNGAGGGLDLDSSELGLLVNGVANRLLVSGGAMTVQSAVSRVGQGTFLLSGNTLGQAAGATITADDLRLSFSTVTLPEANNIGTLTGFASTLNLSNASLLTVGSASAGLSTSAATLKVDDLNVANTFSGNTITITPLTPGRRINLGGADVGGELNISASDLANIAGATVALNADLVDIRGPVSTPSGNLVIAPVTSIPINIVSGPGKAALGALEFLPSELNQVTTSNTFTLGDPSVTGAITVSAPVDLTAGPGSVGTFALQTGNAGGITVNNPLSAQRIVLAANAMAINAAVNATAGDLTVVQNTGGTTIGLGTGGGTLQLDATEAGLLGAAGTLRIGNTSSGAVTIGSPGVTFAGIGGLNITTGGTLTAAGTLSTPGELFLTAGDMAISSAVTASSHINAALIGNMTLGGAGVGLTDAELDFLAPGSGILRLGDFSNTGNILITGPLTPASTTTLNLRATGSITQSVGVGGIAVSNLAAQAFNNITLNEPNTVSNVALSGNAIGYKHGGAGAFTIGTVDGVSGISGGTVTVTANEVNVNDNIFASSLTFTRSTAGALDLGNKPGGGTLGFNQAEFDRMFASIVNFGTAAGNTVNSATVTAPMTANTFSDLTIFSTGPINVANALTANNNNITLVANSMTFSGGANSITAANSINLRPFTAGSTIDVGGPDAGGTTSTLGLDAADVAALSAPNIAIGDATVTNIAVTVPTVFGASNVTFNTQGGGTGTVDIQAGLTAGGNLTFNTDNFVPVAAVTAPNVTLATVTFGRTVDLGTAATGTQLGLDQAQLNTIITPGTFTIVAGNLSTSAAVAFSNAANVALLADTTSIGHTISQTTGGRITVAPRTSFAGLNLGTTGLTQAEIGNFSTSGVLQLGNTTTGTIDFSAPITAPGGIGALALVSAFGITQSAGSTITAPNLRIQTSSATLNESNSVGNLAGSASTLNFTTAGALNIGAVDGATGLSGSTIDLRSDTITVSNPISGFNVTLAPRQITAPIDVGSKPAGVFGVSDAEIDMISANTLSIGTASHTGVLNVTAPVDRASGTFNLAMAPAGTINVNAAFASPNGSVGLTGGTVNVNAPVTAQSTVTVTGDNVQIAAPIGSSSTTPLSSATVQPISANRPISLGTEVSGAMSLTAAELALINSNFLTIGSNNSGALAINAPVTSATLDQLTLRSGSSITQSPGAPILLQKVTATGQRVGNLSAFAGTGGVDLRAAGNEVPGVVQGSAGTGQNFLFNNSLPTKLQNISASAGGKVLVNSGLFGPLPPPLPEGGSVDFDFQAQLLAAIDKLADINDALDENDAEAKKKAEDEKKKQRECGA